MASVADNSAHVKAKNYPDAQPRVMGKIGRQYAHKSLDETFSSLLISWTAFQLRVVRKCIFLRAGGCLNLPPRLQK